MRKQLLPIALLGSGLLNAHGEASGLLTGNTFKGDSTFDKIWSLATLYKDDDNPVLQEFSLQGRLQVQYADGANHGRHYDIEDYKNSGKDEVVWGDHFEARRAYLGIKSKWFQNWKLEGQIDVDTDLRDGNHGNHTIYKDIYDLYLTYAYSDALNISIGKQELKISREQEISSKDIVTLERSNVANMIHPGNLSGIWVSGKGIADYWLYEAGVYDNAQVREFSELKGGTLYFGKVGYDYSSFSGMDSAVASLRYAHNTLPGYRASNSDSNYTPPTDPPYSDVLVLSNDLVQGRFGLTTDLIYAFGYHGFSSQLGKRVKINQPNVLALDIIPSYFIADGLQAVGRLQLASSEGPNGLGLQSRYEAVAPSKDRKGNGYVSVYGGLNWYIYGNKLKVMNGIEWSHLGGGDYDGYEFYSGVRLYF